MLQSLALDIIRNIIRLAPKGNFVSFICFAISNQLTMHTANWCGVLLDSLLDNRNAVSQRQLTHRSNDVFLRSLHRHRLLTGKRLHCCRHMLRHMPTKYHIDTRRSFHSSPTRSKRLPAATPLARRSGALESWVSGMRKSCSCAEVTSPRKANDCALTL